MKTRILIALIASLQLGAPAFALEQSDWISPDSSIDTSQVDIVGAPATTVNTSTTLPTTPMQSGWITQNEQAQPAQSGQATAAPAQSAQCSQSSQCSQSGATGQSQWVTSNGPSDQSQIQGKVTKTRSSGSGSGTAAAVGSAIGHAAGGLAAAAVAVPMMMAASRMMYPGGYGGYGGYGMGGFRGYGPGAYYGRSMGMGMGGMMGGYMLQNAAFNMMRGL